ncbi:MAG TPA: type II secretion system minor pseudopilin GspI [Oxalicibacterium sp.]|uniref:type II secretion system minor pseudopilin GspI n=1 Tax=Oxalicibacterium sp. TaxID=2766525 RepID=UPI002CDF8948|nr:type II secretion system minor pseudopilin GspI [Oxalicibacterium sp.]HWU97061.1 type II secretion system minor pseudopilin GspI [Oxalicibacterium sp.]
MHRARFNHRPAFRAIPHRSTGFTLLEVLVALLIVGTALGASLRAVGSLTRNSADLRASMMANWSAENRLAQIRLTQQWQDTGRHDFPCPQGDLPLYCTEVVLPTPNPFFRRVEVSVYDSSKMKHKLVALTQVISNGR